MSQFQFNEGGQPGYGVTYGTTSTDSTTPSLKRPRDQFSHSSDLLEQQERFAKMRDEIRAGFEGEEERKYLKQWRKKFEKAARHEARLDLELENRMELGHLQRRLEAEVLGRRDGLMAELEREREKNGLLEKRLEKAQREIEELTAAAVARGEVKARRENLANGEEEVVVVIIDDSDGPEGEEEEEGEEGEEA